MCSEIINFPLKVYFFYQNKIYSELANTYGHKYPGKEECENIGSFKP